MLEIIIIKLPVKTRTPSLWWWRKPADSWADFFPRWRLWVWITMCDVKWSSASPYSWSFWAQGSPSRWGQRWVWGTDRSPDSGPWGGRWACRRWCCPSCRWARCCSGSPGCCGCGAGCSPAGPGLWRRSPPGCPGRCGGTAERWWSPARSDVLWWWGHIETVDNILLKEKKSDIQVKNKVLTPHEWKIKREETNIAEAEPIKFRFHSYLFITSA